ncbi:MAG: UDP-N-acetylglucosamine 2-epimerase (non-hydrolyzing) [Gemmatimonadales bacterium]
MSRSPLCILSVLGTRPEVIKMAPVIAALGRDDARFASRVCITGQHRALVEPLLALFAIRPDHDLAVMRAGQTPGDVLAAALPGLQSVLRHERPDWVLAEGDTTTVMATAIAAFHERVPFGHVEAGLRSRDFARPFPEEFNRRVADLAAGWWFAPTAGARANLLREGAEPARVLVTGNTVVDAILDVSARPAELPADLAALTARRSRLVMVTMHRRESFGGPLEQLCLALADLADAYRDSVQFVYPVHPNPSVQSPVHALLGGRDNVALVEPLEYGPFVQLLGRSALVITDSGGVLEEAPTLNVPAVVLREVTERPEAFLAGAAVLAGTAREGVVAAVRQILDDESVRRAMLGKPNPYGDGHAAERIVAALAGEPVEPFAG